MQIFSRLVNHQNTLTSNEVDPLPYEIFKLGLDVLQKHIFYLNLIFYTRCRDYWMKL